MSDRSQAAETKVSERSGAGEEQPELVGEAEMKFVTGFPCSQHTCTGTLRCGVYAGQDAIVCSACEQLYYFVQTNSPGPD